MGSFARLKDLVIVLTQKELKSRYKNLGLGYFWSLANPLAYGFIYYMIFKHVMKVNIPHFPLYIICGLFPWQWFTNSIGIASSTFIQNASLIKKVNFQRNLLSLVSTAQDLIHYLASVPVIFAFMLLFHQPFSPLLMVGIPILCAVQLLYTYSLGLLISTANIFFRDVERLIGIFMTVLFYLTPIVYSPDMVPEPYRPYLLLNPLAPLIMSWRSLFLDGSLEWKLILICFGYGIVFFTISHAIYRRLVWRFAEVL